MYAGFWWRNRKEKLRLIDLSIDKRIILKMILRKYNEIAWSIQLVQNRDK